jgi:multidrug efflux system membrane fusion protein
MKGWSIGKSPRQLFYGAAGIAVVCLAVWVIFWRHGSSQAAQTSAPPAIPVTVTAAAQRDVAIYRDALGTVQALNTVAIRAQINGQIISIDFRQGQDVHKSDVLAKIDPAPLQATLDQAVSKKGEDQAQLIDAEKDLARFQTLVQKNFETFQNLVAPIDGVVGFRQVDIGNIIHTNDANPLTVLTQIKPCTVLFTLPQDDLGSVREAMLQGTVPVLAYDQNDKEKLAEGHLLLINNQIDQTTSSIQLKAEFPNDNERLWPGEFVRIRLLVATRKDVVTIPPVAVQRGPSGLYTWVVKSDNTVDQRVIETTSVNNDVTIVTKGIAAGEQVVVNGQFRLDIGTHVNTKTQAAGGPDKT